MLAKRSSLAQNLSGTKRVSQSSAKSAIRPERGKPFPRETRVDFKTELNNLISRWFMEFHVYIYILYGSVLKLFNLFNHTFQWKTYHLQVIFPVPTMFMITAGYCF